MTDKPTDPVDAQLQAMSEVETAEWSCRSLIRSLLQPRDEPADVSEALDYARKILEVGADALLRRTAVIDDPNERIDAFGDIELMVEGALRLGAGVPLSEVERIVRRSPGRPPKVDDETVRLEVFRLMDYHSDFVAGDREWNAQARLEEAIANKFGLTTGRARARIKEPLQEWRRMKSGS